MKKNGLSVLLWLVCFNLFFVQTFSATSEAQNFTSSMDVYQKTITDTSVDIESCPATYPVDCGDGTCCPLYNVCIIGVACCPSSTPVYCGDGICSSSVGNCPSSSVCPFSMVLGKDNPKLENLRSFRDNTLAKNTVGRKLIAIYYNNSESINAALNRSPALRAIAKNMLEVIAPMVGNKQ